MALVLREEVDLLELDLADVVLAYLAHIEARGELDLETATEFIVLIAALLELKSRLMLPEEEVEDLLELGPEEAAEELLARMLAAQRYPRGRRGSCRSCSPRRRVSAFRRAPVPRRFRREGDRAGGGHRPTPRRSARRSAGCCGRRRRSACDTCSLRA